MPITIKPQDRTPLEKMELTLHPHLIVRLRNYAKALNDSDVSYVVSELLYQVLPGEKATKKAAPNRVITAKDKQAKTGDKQTKGEPQ